MEADLHEAMGRALELARRAWGDTHPNPMVGAVILEGGEIVAEGWHRAAGEAHAEIAALETLARPPAKDATLCVTLEPCSTQGRTGACTEAIIRSGIRRVVVGTTDPNPAHAGHGLDILRQAGIEVISGIREEECRDLNILFNHWITTGKPFMAAKIATTLDGKIAARSGHSRWITGPAARADAHRWRKLFPAIACGSGTVQTDDPSLTSRPEGGPVFCPRRFIFDRSLAEIGNLTAKVYTDEFREHTTVVTWENVAPERVARLKGQGIAVWTLPAEPDNVFFESFTERCASEGITGVLIEGGPRLLSAMLAAGKLDYLFAYQAPKLLADEDAPGCFTGQEFDDINQAFRLTDVRHAILGEDHLVRGFLSKP